MSSRKLRLGSVPKIQRKKWIGALCIIALGQVRFGTLEINNSLFSKNGFFFEKIINKILISKNENLS
jgi:hypothetical protein